MMDNKHIRLSEFKNGIPEENIKFMNFKKSQDRIGTFTDNFIKTMVVRYRKR